ncbi:MAG: hypothetical protein KME27_04595 [Lyngbya sp. HA4199-MV5]|nr:hypothetical protein [Lyngbya sp. HA4199-MV5]
MNQDNFKHFQSGFAEVSRWLLPFAVIWLLGAIGLGWLVKSFLILVGLIIITPVIAFFGFRWWLKRNLIQSDCPVCHHEFISLNQTEFACPSCSEPLRVENGQFNRLTPPGTIDVSAVEVPAQTLDD